MSQGKPMVGYVEEHLKDRMRLRANPQFRLQIPIHMTAIAIISILMIFGLWRSYELYEY